MAKLTVMKGVGYTEKRAREWLKKDGAVVIQTKRDEFRCKVCITEYPPELGLRAVSYESAQGKPLFNLECFDDMWLEIARVTGQRTFDMGVMVQDSFDLTRRTVRASKKKYDLTGGQHHEITDKKKGVVTFHYEGPLKARFWFYDLPEHPELYNERRAIMASYHKNFPEFTGIPETEVVMVDQLYNEFAIDRAITEIKELFELALINKHEGLMVKRFEYAYKEGRSTDWMKMKPEEEVDGEVVGYTDGKDGFAGMVGSIECRAEDGSTFSCSGFSLELRQELTANGASYIGKWLEARYMQRDSAGGYRHPRFYRWHPDK